MNSNCLLIQFFTETLIWLVYWLPHLTHDPEAQFRRPVARKVGQWPSVSAIVMLPMVIHKRTFVYGKKFFYVFLLYPTKLLNFAILKYSLYKYTDKHTDRNDQFGKCNYDHLIL